MDKFNKIYEMHKKIHQDALAKVLNKNKVKHSMRVVSHLDKLPKHVKIAAIYHDFIENGGDENWLYNNVNSESIKLIRHLSIEDGSTPLEHLKSVISSIEDEDEKNFVILIKIADRLDNFKKRIRKNELSEKYRKKTKKLLEFLIFNYTGNKKILKRLLKKF